MKFSTVITGLFAASAAAAPAQEQRDTSPALNARSSFDASAFNGLTFNQIDLRYLHGLNAFDLQLFQNLHLVNGLDIAFFQGVFNAQVFDINAILQLQTLQTLLAIGQTGVFNKFDLATLQLSSLNLGVLGIGAVELNQFIDTSLVGQIQGVAESGMLQPHSGLRNASLTSLCAVSVTII